MTGNAAKFADEWRSKEERAKEDLTKTRSSMDTCLFADTDTRGEGRACNLSETKNERGRHGNVYQVNY